MRKIMKKYQLVSIAFIALITSALFAQNSESEEQLPVERYALYIAANDGGKGREQLRYAVSDAKRLAATMEEVGGVATENSLLLTDPARKDIHDAFNTFSSRIASRKGKTKRCEFLVYYSGHSDENALLLGDESFSYSELKTSLSNVPSDVHVVMLDSCFSGSFIRTKGGSRKQPFLMDDSTEVQGHAYLSSSSAHESSQESDEIKASYFTYSLITGLRGAADTSGDRRVSLNELYYYAFNDTLSQTESTDYGPQHPSFNITMVGSGDLVMTDISEAQSVLIFPAETDGRYFIRDSNGNLVSELNKTAGTEIALALPAGQYILTLVTPLTTSQATITLKDKEHFILASTPFLGIPRASARQRGTDSEDTPFEEITDWKPFVAGIAPGLTIPSSNTENANVSLGLFLAKNDNIKGFQGSVFGCIVDDELHGTQASLLFNHTRNGFRGAQISSFMNSSTNGSIEGAQISAFFNTACGQFTGVQGSGFLNITRDQFKGVQFAGFMNIANSSVEGVQAAGFMNIAREVDGVQAGLINFAKSNTGLSLGLVNIILDGVFNPGVCLDTNGNLWMQYQGGTKALFTTLFLGYDTRWNIDSEAETVYLGLGVGKRFQLTSRFSIDIEALSRLVLDTSDNNEYIEMMKNEEDIVLETNEDWNDFYESFVHGIIPSVRVSLNTHILKHLTTFVACNIDLRIDHFNNSAFEVGSHHGSFKLSDTVRLYPSLAFGLKF